MYATKDVPSYRLLSYRLALSRVNERRLFAAGSMLPHTIDYDPFISAINAIMLVTLLSRSVSLFILLLLRPSLEDDDTCMSSKI